MDGTNPKPFVFVLMPFGKEFQELYQLGIKEACEHAGAYCERVDEQVFVESILERIYNQIAKADVIVSDMTGRNANVFYETGYAHALNKQVILLTKDGNDIPFDLKHYPHIIYGDSIITIRKELEPRIRWCVENPSNSLKSVDINLALSVNKIPLVENPTITVHASNKNFFKYFDLMVNLHNQGNRVIEPKSFSLSVVVPEPIEVAGGGVNLSTSQIPDEKLVVNLQSINRIFPDSWHSFKVPCQILTTKASSIAAGSTFNLVLRLHTEIGPKDYPFRLRLNF
jgi:hypothetical protein